MLHFGKIPKTFGQNSAKIQRSSGKIFHSYTSRSTDSWYQGGLLLESVKRCSSSTSQCPAPGGDNPTPPIALSRFNLAPSGRPPGQTGVFSTRERPPTQSSTKGKTATRSPKKSLGRNNPSALWTTVVQIPSWCNTTRPKPSWVEHCNWSFLPSNWLNWLNRFIFIIFSFPESICLVYFSTVSAPENFYRRAPT